jgi:ATP-dependent exoDNAse (exonuclease V) beta subunit
MNTSPTPTPLYTTLLEKNAHPRDADIAFDEPTHVYTVNQDPDTHYTSVTTWNHSHFATFDADAIIRKMYAGKNWNPGHKYWGMSPQEIKDQWKQNADNVSSLGTNLHYEIECFMNQPVEPCTHEALLQHYLSHSSPSKEEEWDYFLQFVRDRPTARPYRTEWMIYDEDVQIAGSIDMVYENDDGTLSIYDWKRSKEITKTSSFQKYAIHPSIEYLPDTNYWHYSLQLNTYQAILERKYGKKIRDLYLVRLHPSHPKKTYEIIRCAHLQDEIRTLFDERLTKMKTT